MNGNYIYGEINGNRNEKIIRFYSKKNSTVEKDICSFISLLKKKGLINPHQLLNDIHQVLSDSIIEGIDETTDKILDKVIK